MMRVFYKTILPLLVTCGFLLSCTTGRRSGVRYDETVLADSTMWVVEQGEGGKVLFTGRGIEIFDSTGCTLWFKPKLKQPLTIEYQIKVIDRGGPYDRLSDANVFWLAEDPKHPDDLFYRGNGRTGQFRQYDHLRLYYVGMGGHDNTRTRFRRYDGKGNRPVKPEHDLTDSRYLLEHGKTYTIRIEASGKHVRFLRDGHVFYDILDEEPLLEGWFGFRTWRSHQLISGFRVF